MPSLAVTCPKCSKSLKINAASSTGKYRCPECQHHFYAAEIVPSVHQPAPASQKPHAPPPLPNTSILQGAPMPAAADIDSFVAPSTVSLGNPNEGAAKVGAAHQGSSHPSSPRSKAERFFPSVPGYEILSELGRGGMGVVYKARQVKLDRLVAVKMILSGAQAGAVELERFATEAQAVARLHHPNIVQIYEVGEWRSEDRGAPVPFFTLEYCDGGSLARKIDGTPQNPRFAAAMVERLADAMAAAHDKDIIHRDLKPANILLQRVEQPPRGEASDPSTKELRSASPKITDFGLAKKLDDVGQTASGAVMGTPSYMAPEQASGKTKELGPLVDVYALGAILYELLTGRPPFKGATQLETLLQVVSAEPVPPGHLNPKTPRDLETICLKCLQKDPGKRYRSAAVLAEDLRRHRNNEPIAARPVGKIERGWRWCLRNPALAALLGAFAGVLLLSALVATVLAGWALGEKGRADDEAKKAIEQAELAEKNSQKAKENETIAQQNEKRALRTAYNALVSQADSEAAAGNLIRVRAVLDNTHWELRGWEYGFLRRLAENQSLPLKGHTGIVTYVRFSPDGARVATSSSDKTARIWSLMTGTEHLVLRGHDGTLDCAVFNPDGKKLATTCHDGYSRVWDAESGKLLAILKTRLPLSSRLAWNADGSRAVSTCLGPTIVIWDTATGDEIRQLQGHTHWVPAVAWHHGSNRILTGSHDNSARIWDPDTGKELVRLLGHERPLSAVAWSADGKRVITSAQDGTARIWDAHSGKMLISLRETGDLQGSGGNWIEAVDFHPDNRHVATGSWRGIVRLWDAQSGVEVKKFQAHAGCVQAMQFRHDGVFLATSSVDGTARVWDLRPAQEAVAFRGHNSGIIALAWDPTGRNVITASWDSSARVWDADAPKQLQHLAGHSGVLWGMRSSPDGNFVVTASSDHTARVWKLATGTSVILRGHGAPVLTGAFSADGQRLVTGSDDRTARIWDPVSGKQLLVLTGHEHPVWAADFSSDGRRVVTGSADASARLWDLATGKQLTVFRGHSGTVFVARFSPDGQKLLTSSEDGTARIWDLGSGKEWVALRGHTGPCRGANWSADGSRVVTASHDGSVRVWDPAAGMELIALRLPKREVWTVSFNPDGTRIAAGTNQGSVHIWEGTFANELFAVPLSAPDPSIAFTDDSRRLLIRYAGAQEQAFDLPSLQFADFVAPPKIQFEQIVSPDGRFEARLCGSYVKVFARSPLTLAHDPWRLLFASTSSRRPRTPQTLSTLEPTQRPIRETP